MVANLEQLDFILSDDGRELMGRLSGIEPLSAAGMRLGEDLRRRYPVQLVAAAFTLHELRSRARAKFDRAEAMVFTRAGLEQASGERIARHRAQRFAAVEAMADLCTGIGGDLLALAAGSPVLGVDRDPLHLRMALANAAVYGVAERVTARLDDVTTTDLTGLDAVFIDPARRTERGRSGPGRSQPPLAWCVGLAGRIGRVGIKAAPGIDLESVPGGWEVEFVADGRDLKEAALWSPNLASADRRATVLLAGGSVASLTPGLEPGPGIGPPSAYLLDPNPAVTRAGLVGDLAVQVGAWQIDEQIAFLAADTWVQTPFARTLRVIDSVPWHLRHLGQRLRELEIGSVEIRRRGLAGDVEELRRRLRLRGPRRATLAMTRLRGQPWCLICEEVNAPPPIGAGEG